MLNNFKKIADVEDLSEFAGHYIVYYYIKRIVDYDFTFHTQDGTYLFGFIKKIPSNPYEFELLGLHKKNKICPHSHDIVDDYRFPNHSGLMVRRATRKEIEVVLAKVEEATAIFTCEKSDRAITKRVKNLQKRIAGLSTQTSPSASHISLTPNWQF